MTVTIKEKTKKRFLTIQTKTAASTRQTKDRDRIYNQLLKDVPDNNHNFDISHEECSLKVGGKKEDDSDNGIEFLGKKPWSLCDRQTQTWTETVET